jgi:hypothetical protein
MVAVKTHPEISINPLAEYVGASERRKRAILRQQKYPSDFIVARYRTARAAFSNYFKDGYDQNVLIRAIERLQGKKPTSDWSRNDTVNSIEALRRFLSIEIPFKSLKCRFSKPDIKAYNINGVSVIVSPDLMLEWEVEGQKYVGAIKFYIKKKDLTLQQGRLSASLIADFMRRTNSEETTVSKRHCVCVDVMNQRIFAAPGNIIEDMNSISDACYEINTLWLAS